MFDEYDELSSRVGKSRQKYQIKYLEWEGVYRKLDELNGLNDKGIEYNADNHVGLYLDYLIHLFFNSYPYQVVFKYKTEEIRNKKFKELKQKLESENVVFV